MSAPAKLSAPGRITTQTFPVGPSLEAWRAIDPEQREDFPRAGRRAASPTPAGRDGGGAAPQEGEDTRPGHARPSFQGARSRGVPGRGDDGRVPGRAVFSADLLAVVGMEEPERERLAWVVADEGRGLDLVIEVLFRGDRNEDLVENVERYARLGSRILCVQSPPPAAPRVSIPHPGSSPLPADRAQLGRYGSAVLGLDLSIERGRLRFFVGMAELFDTPQLIGRLAGLMENLEAKADEAEARAEAERLDVEAARAGLRTRILAVLVARGLPCPEDVRSRVLACSDVAHLQRWAIRAATASTVAQVFSTDEP